MKKTHESWNATRDDAARGEEVVGLSRQFGKAPATAAPLRRLREQDLELICFEYVSG